jgi:hypothetical protein
VANSIRHVPPNESSHVKLRSPAAVFLLPFVTLFISFLVWEVSTKKSMNEAGAGIPTTWMQIIPILNYVWIWKYAGGAAEYTKGAVSQAGAFWLLALLGPLGAAVLQSAYNKQINANVIAGVHEQPVPVAA